MLRWLLGVLWVAALLCGAGPALAGGEPELGGPDKTPYVWAVEAGAVKRFADPALGGELSLAGLGRVGPVVASLRAASLRPVAAGWNGWSTQGGLAYHPLGNGLQGPWFGLRAGYRHFQWNASLYGDPAVRDMGWLGLEEPGWSLDLGPALGARWIFHPGFTIGLDAAILPSLYCHSLYTPPAAFSTGVVLGWADAPGRNPRPGYRSRKLTGQVKPEIVALAVAGGILGTITVVGLAVVGNMEFQIGGLTNARP